MQLPFVDNKYVILLILLVTLSGIFLYQPPKAEPDDNSVFVYGTLKYPIIRNLVCLCRSATTETTLQGFRKNNLNILPSEGDEVKGKIIYVDDEELARIDNYEDVPDKYRREKIMINGQEHFVYLLNQ
jgi:gamma-glutamylcyclotransferase (GGCT)/AIG2-like uncharacterized protein YtfP